MTIENFGIKAGYVENVRPKYFVDDVTATRGIVFQPDVYTFAEMLGKEIALQHNSGVIAVVDVGCGWGEKLAAMRERQPNWGFVGVDYGQNITHCRATFDWGEWIDLDLEHVSMLPWGNVVICSDVIEHLVDPVPLIRALASMGSGAKFVFSTPERDVQYGYDHMGPSINDCHVREWNALELKTFLESERLIVDHIGLTRGSDQGWAMGTTLVVAH